MHYIRANIDGFEIPTQALNEVIILSNKIALSGKAFAGEEMARFYAWLKSQRQERMVIYLVEAGNDKAQGKGTLKYLARAGKSDKAGSVVKFKISIWL
jgi:hypothetical protein